MLVLLVGMAACGDVEPVAQTPIPVGSLVIRNGTVIDGTGAEPVAGGLIVIQGERIAAVGPAADYNVP